ncbi:MAG: FAD-binding protein [Deltaproteobacteria bacterium]|nr:FAD-binding protein [Deltaproteobacteria bacterium]
MSLPPPIKKKLGRIFEPKSISFSKEDLLCYSYDATGESHLPDVVVFPTTAEEISLTLKLANESGFPVIPRGGGSGFTGGTLPVSGGVVISTQRMTSISIDQENLVADVGSGLLTGDLQDEVEELGLFYPPDPTSVKFSTIGGNIAENAGGPRAVKYGTTRDYVLGLEVVLPNGDIVRTGVKTAKGVVGYDLTRLLVGSEGTLGIITKAFLRLIPKPKEKALMYAVFGDLASAADVVSTIIREKITPSTLEFIDGASIRCAEEYVSTGIKSGAEAVLLIETDGTLKSVEDSTALIKKICQENKVLEFRVAKDKKEIKDLWKLRKNLSPALYKIKPTKINEDIVVPRSMLTSLVTGVQEIAEARGVLIVSFGHAGDGNIHVNVMIDKDDPDEAKRGAEAVSDVFDLTLSLGGTISGEHGVGVTKAPYLSRELSSSLLSVMRGIKDVLDPKGILNPGKIFLSPSNKEN